MKLFGFLSESKNSEQSSATDSGLFKLDSVSPVTPALVSHAQAVISTLSEVGAYSRILTVGGLAVYKVAQEHQYDLVAIEVKARAAVILCGHSMLQSPQLTALRGALLKANLSIQDTRLCERSVMESLVQAEAAKTDTGRTSSKNIYLEASNEWIQYAVANRATDIHILTRGNMATVQFRVDGELETMRQQGAGVYTADFAQSVMSSLYNNEQAAKSGSDPLFKPEAFLYCMVPYDQHGHQLKLRFQSLRGDKGPAVVLRLLSTDPNAPTRTFEDLGYAPSHCKQWISAMETPSGAIFITGVTGSGKSTTLKTLIELICHDGTKRYYTFEDPVEYPIRNAHQIPVQRDLTDDSQSGKSYKEVVTAVLRADLDGAMVGEVRDYFTANTMMQLANTGHMGLATLHSNQISSLVPRLTDSEIGLGRDVLCTPNLLTLLNYQALVPVLCPECRMTTSAANEIDASVGRIVSDLSVLNLDMDVLRWKRPMGCKHCAQRGTIEQTVCAEIMLPTEGWLTLIKKGDDIEAKNYWRLTGDGRLDSDNMDGKTVFEHTLYKAFQQITDLRQCLRFDSTHRFVSSWQALDARRQTREKRGAIA